MIGFVETPACEVEPGDRVLVSSGAGGVICLRDVKAVVDRGPEDLVRLRFAPMRGSEIGWQNELLRPRKALILVALEGGEPALPGQLAFGGAEGSDPDD